VFLPQVEAVFLFQVRVKPEFNSTHPSHTIPMISQGSVSPSQVLWGHGEHMMIAGRDSRSRETLITKY
jgi:hypothetical protein